MKTYLEPEEIAKLEQAAEYLRDRLLIRVLFRLGCRISEALGIGVEDIDFARGTVRIEHLKARIRLSCPHCGARLGKSHAFCPKCGATVEKAVAGEQEHRRMRTLPLDRESLGMLRDYIQRGGPISRNGVQVVFGISRNHAWRIVKECAEKAGLGRLVNPETGRVHGVSPHRLRDAFAVMAVKRDDSGDALRLLQEHLGHVSFNTTAKYRKVAGEEHREWYERLWQQDKKGWSSRAELQIPGSGCQGHRRRHGGCRHRPRLPHQDKREAEARGPQCSGDSRGAPEQPGIHPGARGQGLPREEVQGKREPDGGGDPEEGQVAEVAGRDLPG
jgi:integrase/recombinase XerD